MIKIIDKIDIADLLEAYTKIENEIQWTDYGHKGKQAGLQYSEPDDPWSSSVGRSKGQELSYSTINPFFKNTIFDEIIQKYNLSRTRLMWSNPYSCYSMHRDSTPRIHVPLITNPECYFVFKAGLIQHMPINAVYRTNTILRHTFINCSDLPRLHLVGAVLN